MANICKHTWTDYGKCTNCDLYSDEKNILKIAHEWNNDGVCLLCLARKVEPIVETEIKPVIQLIVEDGKLPLREGHICFDKGHAMVSLFTLSNGFGISWGQLKCFRCGYIEDWQYNG